VKKLRVTREREVVGNLESVHYRGPERILGAAKIMTNVDLGIPCRDLYTPFIKGEGLYHKT
jgi:hypothetical protein